MGQEEMNFLEMQKEQFEHDKRNHSDIICLHKNDRLKHYGLHFSKYVGRLARGSDEVISVERTLVDCALVSLSAANTLHQNFGEIEVTHGALEHEFSATLALADAAGRFADACEKIDHMEEFIRIAKNANTDIFRWVIQQVKSRQITLNIEISKRRRALASRQFFIGS